MMSFSPLAFALAVSLASGAAAPQSCPEVCAASGYGTTFGSSDCVQITTMILSVTNGKATSLCESTCNRCSALIKMEVNCDACPGGCSWAWVSQGYERDGSPIPPGAGGGTGSGSTRQTIQTSCNGPEAFFGMTAGGFNVTNHLTCSCL